MHCLRRGWASLLNIVPVDLAIEVGVDRVLDLGAQRAVVVDEGVAQRLREVLRVTAEPDAAQQQHQGTGNRYRCLGQRIHESNGSRRGQPTVKTS